MRRGVSIRNKKKQLTSTSLVKVASNVSEDINKRVKKSFFRSKRRVIRYGLLASNVLLIGVIAAFIISNRNSSGTAQQSTYSLASETEVINPLDTLSSADIAVNIALMAQLDQTVAVINNADTVKTQLNVIPSDAQVVDKPQIVDTELKSKKDIKQYKVQKGDDVKSLAKKFDVTSESIRWSNNLSSNALSIGDTIFIPPVNGIVYKVKSGDTPESIASKFRASESSIIGINDAEISGLKVGEHIIIPDGKIIAPTYSPSWSTASVGGFAFGSSAIYGYNGYDYGWCTWWAAKRRADVGKPIPTNFGNACNWIAGARFAGIGTGSQPKKNAVIFTNSGCLGHVGFVEEVNEDGSIWVTDMNSRGQVSKTDSTPAGGWNRVSWRRVTPDQFGTRFQFIY